jgi:ABC-type bacteriocin/lantibiotic exporter with double-glycine peptidase domain
MANTAKTQQSATTLKYENIIATLSILGIGGYLVLRYALNIGHEVYALSVNAALTSAIASLYQELNALRAAIPPKTLSDF